MKKEIKKEVIKESKFDYRNSWFVLPLLILCAILAGVFGETIIRTLIFKDAYSPYSYYNEVNLSNLAASNPSLVIRDPKMVVVNQDVKLAETISSLRPSIVSLYERVEVPEIANKLAEGEIAESINYSYYYDLEKPLAIAYIITSDGWLVASVDQNFVYETDSLIAIDSSRKTYEIKELSDVNEDGLIFIQLNEARNMPVRKNITKSDFFLGQSLLAISDLNSVDLMTLNSLSQREGVLSSEMQGLDLGISKSASSMPNSFVFNFAGDLAFIINNDGLLIPGFSYNYHWQSLSEEGNMSKAYLGLNYLDLRKVKIASSSTDIDKGALLISDGIKPAVLADSPADLAGLQEHDIITWINNREINSSNDLAEIISSYKAGDQINISYLRQGESFRTEVVLGLINDQLEE